MTLTQVTSQAPARVVVGGSGPGVLVNRDLVNAVYTSPNFNFSSGDPTASIHDPLIGIPYDGESDVYAVASPGNLPSLMDFIENADNWAPSPAQAAQQISLLGLATATNQQAQITQETLTATNTTGVAKDSSLGTVNFNLSAGVIPNQNVANALSAAFGSPTLPVALNPNPFLTNPANGNADGTGWGSFQASIATAGQGAANTLPAGGGIVNGLKVTPTGGLTRAVASCAQMPVIPGQLVQVAFLVWLPTSGIYNLNIEYDWTVNGLFNSATNAPTIVEAPAGWQLLSATTTAPSNIAGLNGVYSSVDLTLTAGGNIPATDIFYVGFAILDSNVPGTAPGRHANSIANTGVPLLRKHNQILSITTGSVAVGTPFTTAVVPFNQIGYSFFFNVYVTAGAVQSELEVSVVWLDQATGTAVDQQIYWIQAGSGSGAANSIRITGPTEGNAVQITFSAFGSAITVANGVLFQNSTTYTQHHPLSLSVTTLAGIANPAALNDTLSNSLGSIVVVGLATGGNQINFLPLYTGRVWLWAASSSAAADCTVLINNNSDQGASGNKTIFQQTTDSQGHLNTFLSLPRSECYVNITNNNAAAKTVSWSIVMAPEG